MAEQDEVLARIPIDPKAPKKARREGKVITVGGRTYEVARRYKDLRGQVWCVVKMALFPDGRPGAKPPPKGKFIERHIPDPLANQPGAESGPSQTALEV